MRQKRNWIIGSRSSKLALAQAFLVKKELEKANPGLEIAIKTIKTTGDKVQDVALSKFPDKGLFTKEIEESLLKKEIDIAVHSMKDLPVELPEGLKIAAVSKREDPRDVLLSEHGFSIKSLPAGSRVGTSSLRRGSQLLRLRPDLELLDLRGNLDTRIKKLENGLYDAIILAYAGIKRLAIKKKLELISLEEILPQAGQGALGIEIRSADQEAQDLVKSLDDPDSHLCIDAERALLLGLGGGCHTPMGVCAQVSDSRITIRAGVFSLDGKTAVKQDAQGRKEDAVSLGAGLAKAILKQGGKEILDNV